MLVVFLLGALPPMARTTAREEVERFTCRLQDRQLENFVALGELEVLEFFLDPRARIPDVFAPVESE